MNNLQGLAVNFVSKTPIVLQFEQELLLEDVPQLAIYRCHLV